MRVGKGEREERWKYAVKTRGVKVSRNKPEYKRLNERDTGGKVKNRDSEGI